MMSVGTAAHTCRALARSSSGVMSSHGLEALAVPDQRHRAAELVHDRAARGGDGRQQPAHRRRARSAAPAPRAAKASAARPVTAARPRTAGTRCPRASACRPARRPSTGGSGRSPRARGRRRPSVSATITPSRPGRRLDLARVDDRLDLGDPHQVAHRHDADEGVALDDRDVAVAVVGQRGERLLHRQRRVDAVGVGGHQLGHLEAGGRRSGRGHAHDVALGQDADRPVAVDDDDRSERAVAHEGGCGGDGLVGRCGHHRRAHDVGHRADGGCGGHGCSVDARSPAVTGCRARERLHVAVRPLSGVGQRSCDL